MTRTPACTALAAALALATAPVLAFETKGSTALAVDHATGLALYAKNADAPLPPASMSKLMTLYMLFEAIRDGEVDLDTEFTISPKAQAMGGSRMFPGGRQDRPRGRPNPRHRGAVGQRRLRGRGRRSVRRRNRLREGHDRARA
jgi:hypothetical protein